MFKGVREFLMRGNVVDLAVAVVIGAAFGAVVKAFVDNIITPIIAALVGQPDFSGLFFTVNGSAFKYGLFINAVVSFLLVEKPKQEVLRLGAVLVPGHRAQRRLAQLVGALREPSALARVQGGEQLP